MVGFDAALSGSVQHGRFRMSGIGAVGYGTARQVAQGEVSFRSVWCGGVRQVWLGSSRHRQDRSGKVRQVRRGLSEYGAARCGLAHYGKAG